MTDLEKLIDEFEEACLSLGVIADTSILEQEAENDVNQAKQNLLNYIEQNYERKT